jgi:hypothetical protein
MGRSALKGTSTPHGRIAWFRFTPGLRFFMAMLRTICSEDQPMSAIKDDKRSGYKKPPESGQFKKGNSGNPSGRRRSRGQVQVDVEDVLNETFMVTIDGRARRMSAKEIEIRQILKKAIEKKDFRSIAYLIALFEKHDCVAHPRRQNGGVLTVPKGMSTEMAIWLTQYGMPEEWTKRQIAAPEKFSAAENNHEQP